MLKGFVYILKCSDGTLYTGSTNNLDKRLSDHNNKKGANYTQKRLPVELVYFQEFTSIKDAFYREKQIQGWSRKKKLNLINNDFDALKKNAECKNESHYLKKTSTSLSHQKKQSYYSNGKLLLTGEYIVLDGALALAVPTKLGQSLTVEPILKKTIKWTSFDANKTVWYKNIFTFNNGVWNSENDDNTSLMLLKVFESINKMNPSFFKSNNGFNVTTQLNFPQTWGLGSSSTLINNIANWTTVDPYKLLELTFGGSGYDIACASHNSPITYLTKQSERTISEVNFSPSYSDQLFFVHLNQKQNSREGIKHYNLLKGNLTQEIKEISSITLKMITSDTLDEFERLIEEHEAIIAKITKQETVKSRLFQDYSFGSIKSLGAWGGDFVLVSGTKEKMSYFIKKGYHTIIPYKDMIL